MEMFGRIVVLVSLLLTACADKVQNPPEGIVLQGQWITEQNGDVMLNPQTSGLAVWRGKLLTISDGSAHISQRHELHVLDGQTGKLAEQGLKMQLSADVEKSCFGQYLAGEPDYEALVVDPDNDKVFYIVTEDATRTGILSPKCKHLYKDTGSTAYPTLLVRLELGSDEQITVTHTRPLKFSEAYEVGNYPNDGIEGLAMSPDRTLYLALEKDSHRQPRIFTLELNDAFWQTDVFAQVTDPQLKLPQFDAGNHPINGMDYMRTANGEEFLIAAARNDDEIWVVDLSATKETKRIPVVFYAPTGNGEQCEPWELLDNTSLEGVAVDSDGIWLINDPWKANYKKNIQCTNNAAKYKDMAPLLFKLPVQPEWFDGIQS